MKDFNWADIQAAINEYIEYSESETENNTYKED